MSVLGESAICNRGAERLSQGAAVPRSPAWWGCTCPPNAGTRHCWRGLLWPPSPKWGAGGEAGAGPRPPCQSRLLPRRALQMVSGAQQAAARERWVLGRAPGGAEQRLHSTRCPCNTSHLAAASTITPGGGGRGGLPAQSSSRLERGGRGRGQAAELLFLQVVQSWHCPLPDAAGAGHAGDRPGNRGSRHSHSFITCLVLC